MNPGVVFQPIADVVRSIVLTSGTLAPLDTFSSELSTTFTNELQALHIIDENQVSSHLCCQIERETYWKIIKYCRGLHGPRPGSWAARPKGWACA
jgi:hypothetical protein